MRRTLFIGLFTLLSPVFVHAHVQNAMKNPNVTFKVCALALKNNSVDKSQLLAGVSTVPDGIHEIVSKQQDHWGYIKVMH
jgi:uncharacterized protein